MAPNSPFTHAPWQILGYRQNGRPIYAIAGGSIDVEPDAEPNDSSADDDTEPVDDWAPPSREEYERLVEDKRKADGEAAARRKYLRQHGIDPKTGQKLTPDPEPDPEPDETLKDDTPKGASKAEVDRAVRKAAAEAELRGLRKTKGLVVGFNEALGEAGWNGTRLNVLMKLVDLDDIEIDDDGEITGLAEQIGQIKSDFPELFKRERRAAAAPVTAAGSAPAKVDAADKKTAPPEPKSWAEAVARQAVRG